MSGCAVAESSVLPIFIGFVNYILLVGDTDCAYLPRDYAVRELVEASCLGSYVSLSLDNVVIYLKIYVAGKALAFRVDNRLLEYLADCY